MCTAGAEIIGPGDSAALIQESLTQVVWAAKRPGTTVCFVLFIEMSYKSVPSPHRARMGFSEAAT